MGIMDRVQGLTYNKCINKLWTQFIEAVDHRDREIKNITYKYMNISHENIIEHGRVKESVTWEAPWQGKHSAFATSMNQAQPVHQHGSWPACASAQSDQDPYYSLTNLISSRETDSKQHGS
jgi:hypothetical protein